MARLPKPIRPGIKNRGQKGSIKPNTQPSPGPIGNTQGIIVPQTSPNASGANNSAPPPKPKPKEKSWWEKHSDAIHLGLDVVGLIPGVGEIADGANALIYLAEGDKVNAALSAAAMLPVGGQAATAAKLGRKAGQKLEKEAAEKAAREAALKAEREAAKKAEKEAAEKAAKEKAVKEGGHVKGPKKKKLREQYLGRTPGKKSKTGREVIERMEKDGKIERNPITNKVTKFMDSQGNWRDIKDADMAHSKDAVTWWNETGRKDVARSPEVRKWMLDSENYTLDYFKYNRSAGAKLPDRYLPPLK